MLRLALAATMIGCALGETYNGEMFTLYGIYTNNAADSNASCVDQGTSFAKGTADGPDFEATTHLKWSKAFVLEKCYDLTAANILPMALPFETVDGTHKILDGGAAILSIKLTKVALTGVHMLTYTNAACGAPDNPTFKAPVVAGYQCATAMGMTSGYETTGFGGVSDDKYTLNGIFTMNYIKFTHDDGVAVTAGDDQLCSSATAVDDEDGLEWTYAPVCADWDACHNAGGAAINTIAKYQDAGCMHDAFGAADAYQFSCEKETGDIRYDHYNSVACAGAADAGGLRWSRNNACSALTDTNNWNLATYTAAEWTGLCPNPGDAIPATPKSFTAYLSTPGNCATNTGATVATNLGTREIILDICYTNSANGETPGFKGPFSADGAQQSEMVANALSVKWIAGATAADVSMSTWTTPDCSGTATTVIKDDPAGGADGWPCDTDAPANGVSHGGVTSKKATITTGGNYIVVRRHEDKTGAKHNMGGQCHGTQATTLGLRVDYFKLGSSPTDACYQKSAATSYSWYCENRTGSGWSINYEEYTDTACATPATGTWLHFTKKGFDTCKGGADQATDCAAAGTDFATTTLVDAALTAAALSCTTAADCLAAHAGAAQWGGKCLQVGAAGAAGSAVSWELLTSDTDWDAMCAAADGSGGDTDSAAGKIAATVAAGAAAAAALLI